MRRLLAFAFLLGLVATSSAQVNLNAAGATFPYPIYSKWFSEFHNAHSDIQINYQSIGSGGGIQQLKAGTVDFGASDMPLDDEKLKDMGKPIIQLPTVMGSVVPAYNIPGISGEIKFTPEALAGIFLGHIKKWNDKALAEANPGVNLPDQDIVVVHRSDGSGTTFVWTDYLSKVSPEWKSGVGSSTSVKWPTGIGGKGNEQVAGLVRQQPGAIGYVELIYALQNNIPFGPVKNSAGNFVKASLQSTSAAAASVKNMPDDFRISITNATGKNAYPISSFTYLLIPTQWQDQTKKNAVVTFLNWMLDQGQSMVEPLNYAPLPKQVVQKEKAKIKELQ
ncbi:MAG TPA: phosphate ABC transporter substrate-binding protein PstS [Candidatus Sulfotelmatobacter sp.]|nr:phosphate ABC transporter substrate-binding protein PstS [Candidatus Sulfotelmatobacter sp.]